jgi:hypothetical protein
MPFRRFDWHERIKDVEGEYRAARLAVDAFKAGLTDSSVAVDDADVRRYLQQADRKLEGTYIVRLFAAFEAALRSYDRARHNGRLRLNNASTLIDGIGGRRGQGVSQAVRDGAHAVRRVRNFWAHETDANPEPMTIKDARSHLQRYLSWLPDEWV